eukprot:4520220-Pleurochrysis_carterae.AAC.1
MLYQVTNLSHGAHALELVGFQVAAALVRLLVLIALEGRSCSSRSTDWRRGWRQISRPPALGSVCRWQWPRCSNPRDGARCTCRKAWRWWRLCAYGLGGDHGCHLLTQLAQLVAQGGH